MAEEIGKNVVIEEMGRLRIDFMILLVISFELMEERYGEVFIQMADAVQEEAMMLCGNTPIEAVVQCMQKKFEDPEYSMKQGLIEAMKIPKQLS